ncbi:MAG: Tim44-like domain-containing protein [Gammaproteobacteria bacterium]
MKTFVAAFIPVLTIAFLTFSVINDAEAKRMGGGKSFGGKSTFSQAAPKPAPTQNQMANSRQNAQQQTALSQRGGLIGMLGGLALGGLLGALFFGGAFENINFFDILIFVAIAFLLYKLFARKKRASGLQVSAVDNRAAHVQSQQPAFNTDLMFKEAAADSTLAHPAQTTSTRHSQTAWMASGAAIPKDFDTKNFLEGAETAYQRLQKAWDDGDLADIRQFTTDAVFAEIQDQFRTRQGENRTEIIKVDAELLEVRESGSNTEASVMFDAIMREIDADRTADARPVQQREIWHFTRPTNSKQPTWYLDGIQQIED